MPKFAKKTMPELQRMSPDSYPSAHNHGIHLLLENIRSAHNVGSIFRTADAFGVDKIWLCGFTPAPPDRSIEKTALGATASVPFQALEDSLVCAQELKDQGFELIAVEQCHDSEFLGDQPLTGLSGSAPSGPVRSGTVHPRTANGAATAPSTQKPVVLIFGHEVEGVSQELLNLCHRVVEIPQFGSKHSLNVSVSVGVVLWEWRSKV